MSVPARVPGSAQRPQGSRLRPSGDEPRPIDGSRAVEPDAAGFVERRGVRIWWERYGDRHRRPGGPPVIALLPTWSIVHSRIWKAQVADLSRHAPVVLFDGRGNGRSDRPADLDAYAVEEYAEDALAVFDATDTASAVLVGFSMGARWALLLAATRPERVAGCIFIGPALRLAPTGSEPADDGHRFDVEHETYEGWDKYNRHYWRRHYADFLAFFFAECLPEPHSTKQIEDAIGWGLGTDAETLLLTEDARGLGDREAIAALARQVRCPVLVMHGTDDRIIPISHAIALAELTGGQLLSFEGSGHVIQTRDPVRTNLAIRAFVDRLDRPLPPTGQLPMKEDVP